MFAAQPHLDFLGFDASVDTGGVHTFDALASTSRERHAAVLATTTVEQDSVIESASALAEHLTANV